MSAEVNRAASDYPHVPLFSPLADMSAAILLR